MSFDSTQVLRGRFTVMALATALLTSALVAVPVTAQAADPVVGGYTLSQARKIILDDTNAIRKERGLKPLVQSAALNTVAQNWSAKQASARAMSHNPSYPKQYPAGWTTASENVAYGYQVTSVVAAWKDSSGHLENITRASANALGIGVAAASNGSLYFTQNFATYPGGVPSPVATPSAAAGDVIVADTSGRLWNYGRQVGKTARTLIGNGWTGIREVHVTDWNGDGIQDLVVQWQNGQMHVYPGHATGGFASRILIGWGGWGDLEVDIAKWKTTDRYPSIVMKDAAGGLWLYPNTRGTTLSARTSIGKGWSALTVKIADFNKDGKQDVLATNAKGEIWLYRTNGAGKFVAETRPKVGSGWSAFTSVVLSGFGGTGTTGLISRDSTGALFYYPILAGKFGARQALGTGWGTMLLSND